VQQQQQQQQQQQSKLPRRLCAGTLQDQLESWWLFLGAKAPQTATVPGGRGLAGWLAGCWLACRPLANHMAQPPTDVNLKQNIVATVWRFYSSSRFQFML
jgi:hypothetical protein